MIRIRVFREFFIYVYKYIMFILEVFFKIWDRGFIIFYLLLGYFKSNLKDRKLRNSVFYIVLGRLSEIFV